MTVLAKRPAPEGGGSDFMPFGPLHAATLAEAMQEFVVRYGGEWRIFPMEPQDPTTQVNMGNDGLGSSSSDLAVAPRPRIGGMWFEETLWGNYSSTGDSLVFEYGTRRGNVSNYTFNVDRQQVANNIYVPRVGWPEPGRTGTTANVTSQSSESITAMAMRYDAWVDPGEIQLATSRQALADAHRNLRAGPRRIINFTPVPNAELQPWEDYNIGDFVRFRAFTNGGTSLRFDLVVRIYNITATLDANGNESVTVSTSQEATPA
jgi:hypothetical protein